MSRVTIDHRLIARQQETPAGRSIFAAGFLKPSKLDDEFKDVSDDEFSDPLLRACWRELRQLHAEKAPINPQTLTERLPVNGDRALVEVELNDIYCGAVVCGKPTVEIFKRERKSKKLDALAALTAARVAAKDDPDEIAADAERKLSELRDTPTQEKAFSRPDMPDSALDGRLGEITQRRLRGLPLAYSWGAIVTTASVMLDRVNAPIRTNLYLALVGPPSSGKSVSLDYAARVLGMENDPRILQDAKFGSGEGLTFALAEVEPNAVRLIALDELGHLLAKAAIDRSAIPYVLNSGFYHDRQQGGTKQKLFKFDCRLSITGGLTLDMFPDSFGSATVGGLHSRFLFGLCPEPYQCVYRPFAGPSEAPTPFHLSVDDDLWELSNHWVENEGIEPRVAENALRTAYIAAAFDGRPTLRAADLGPAFEFAKYQSRVRIVLAPNEGQNDDARCAGAIRNWLRSRKSGEWFSRRELDRGTHGTQRYGPTLFNRVLKGLAFNQEIDLTSDGKRLRLVQSW